MIKKLFTIKNLNYLLQQGTKILNISKILWLRFTIKKGCLNKLYAYKWGSYGIVVNRNYKNRKAWVRLNKIRYLNISI